MNKWYNFVKMRKFSHFYRFPRLKVVLSGRLVALLKIPQFHRFLKRTSNTKGTDGKKHFFQVQRFYTALNLPGILGRIRFPGLGIGSIGNTISSCIRHKILIITSIFALAFVILFINGIYIDYFKLPRELKQSDTSNNLASAIPTDIPAPTVTPPTDTPVPSQPDVLGTTDNYNLNTSTDTPQTVEPTGITTEPTIDCSGPDGKHLYITQEACGNFNKAWATPTPTITYSPPSNSSNNSGNSNCTTGAGVPNSWYSDVYPNPQITTNTGSVTIIVNIRDCNKNDAPVSDKLNITLSSGDPNTQIKGNSLPYTITTQNGEASFSVSSQNTGTVTLVIQDTTSSFTITDINNHNPSINFNSQPVSTPTATPTIASDSTPTPTPAAAQTPTPTPEPSPSPTSPTN
jgi:hypothetical protein